MRINVRMKLAILLASMSVGYGASSFAGSSFYVELGYNTSQEEAVEQWQKLRASHPDLLGTLEYFPRVMTMSDGGERARIQAGPLPTRGRAQAVCNELFYSNMPCFVIERAADAGGGPEAPRAEQAEAVSAPEPREELADEENVGRDAERGAVLSSASQPWLSRHEKARRLAEMDQRQKAPEGAGASVQPEVNADTRDAVPERGTASVEVAEAVRVPLTNENAQPMAVAAPGSAAPPPMPPAVREEKSLSAPGWLRIGSFAGEGEASSFWHRLSANHSELAGGKRARITRPLLSGARYVRYTLQVGTFTAAAAADRLCQAAFSMGASSCYLVSGVASSTLRDAADKQFSGSRRDYAARRAVPLRHSQPASARYAHRAGVAAAQPASARQHWLEFSVVPTRSAAAQAWRRLQSEHGELLGDLRSQLSSSSAAGRGRPVALFAGPFSSRDGAVRRCNALKARNVFCKVR